MRHINISLTKLFLLILGGILLIVGVYFLIQSIPAKDWVEAILSVVALVAGFALITGKGITVTP